MADKFTCGECGRNTYRDNYEWRDELLYQNLKKLKLCEECYRNGQDDKRNRETPFTQPMKKVTPRKTTFT